MTSKKLNKKVIVTTNFYGVTDGKFITKTTVMAKEAEGDPAIGPLLDPAPSDVIDIIKELATLRSKRNALKDEQKAITERIKKTKDTIKDIFNSKWAPVVQQAVGSDITRLTGLGYGVKGQLSGHSDDVVGKASESQPFIINIFYKSLTHNLEIMNNKTSSSKLPPDAKHIDVYMQIGGDNEPNDIRKMSYIGMAKNGKLIVHFDPEDLDKMIYYIAVYVDKKTLKPVSQSMVKKAKVVMNY